MEDLKVIIKEFINSWKECHQCNMMCNNSNYAVIDDNTIICIDCILNKDKDLN